MWDSRGYLITAKQFIAISIAHGFFQYIYIHVYIFNFSCRLMYIHLILI